jgi:hypothetical protein
MYLTFMNFLIWAQFRQQPPSEKEVGGILAMCAGCGLVAVILIVLVNLIMIASVWKVFTKAGEPGWASLVPIYNLMIMGKISGLGETYGLLCLIPCVGIYFAIVLTANLCKKFGKETGFVVGLLLLPLIFWPILGFGSARYQGGRKRRRRDEDEDEDEDEDDRPRRPARRPVDEDDEDRPRRPKARPRDEDEDEDRPRKPKPRPRDEDEDEDDRPRRPRR